jgi:cell division transport system ATP-binding protein
MIYFDNVSKVYKGNHTALKDVTFSVAPGEFVSIVGHSGAGKTSIIKMILGEEKPTIGTVHFGSIDIHALSSDDISAYRRKIGVVFQDFRLLPNKNAYENLAFAMEVAGKTDEEIAADVPHALDLVDLFDRRWNFPNEMSGGERQRLAIARAIINQPEVIIADEPTGNLDPINTFEIVQILEKINAMGTTVILTTHNKGVIDALNKRVITMDSGSIIRDDKQGKYAI